VAAKFYFLILVALAIPALGQTSPEQANQLPSQAKPVHGVAMPVPKEIFRSLDQFRDANWRAVQRPEIVHWTSQGNQAQIATLLGVVIAEGFVAMEAQDSTEVRNAGNKVLKLAQGLGVQKRALRRSRSIMSHADKNEWAAARAEWDGVLSDLEKGMIELKSAPLSELTSLGGWLRGTEALSALVLQHFSPERSELIRQPTLLDFLDKQIVKVTETHDSPMIKRMHEGIGRIRDLIQSENGPLSEKTVREIHGICEQLVWLPSQRPSELSN